MNVDSLARVHKLWGKINLLARVQRGWNRIERVTIFTAQISKISENTCSHVFLNDSS